MIAGITVGLVLIPQALAYAQLAGMPPVTGLYAALMPGVVGALFGSSSLLAVGPVALTSLLTFAALQPLAEPGSSLWVSMAIWLAIYAGLIQLAMGALRMGAAANIISNAVVQGFINAAAVIIILSQLPSLIGFAEVPGDHWLLRMRHAWQVDSDRVLTTAAFGIGSLLTLLLPLLIGLGALAAIELGGTMTWLLVQPTATVLSGLVLLSSVVLLLSNSVAAQADRVAELVGQPYGTLVLTGAVMTIELALVASTMLTGEANPTLARDSMFSVVMIALTGVTGLCNVIAALRSRSFFVNGQLESMPIGPPALHRLASGGRGKATKERCANCKFLPSDT